LGRVGEWNELSSLAEFWKEDMNSDWNMKESAFENI
jgi:hypothetical protein